MRNHAITGLCLFLLLQLPTSICVGHHDDHPPSLLLGAVFPRLSSDGEMIAFSHQGAIWTTPRAGGEMKQLTDEPGFDVQPAWSPGGDLIAFTRGGGSFVGPVRVVRASNGQLMSKKGSVNSKDRLYFDPDDEARLWGVFQRPGGRWAISSWNWKTGELGPERRPDAWGQRFALSNDGDMLALATTQDVRGQQGGNNGPQCDLWVTPTRGGQARMIARFPGRVYEVEWTSEDDALHIVSNVGGAHNDLWRVPLSDPLRGARKLTFGQADEDSPSVSHDGRWLLYSDNRRGPTELRLRDLKEHRDTPLRVTKRAFRKESGILTMHIADLSEGKRSTARVSIRRDDGKYYAPPAALYRMLGRDVHFYCQGSATLTLPAGRYTITAARGPEYDVARQVVVVEPTKRISALVEIQRWTDQKRRGWYSGESHIHANYGYGQWYNSPGTMLAQCAGEDLMVCNFVVANSEADGVFDREYFRGGPDPKSTANTILYWNEEFRSTIWGHLTLLNLKHLVEPIFTGFAHTTHPHDHPTNADVADLTHDQGGHVNYTHPAHNLKDPYLSAYSAKALPLDAALGKVDSIDVMGSNHAATMPLWHRLLNCGFRIPASAGTDCFLNRIRSRLPGQARVYVKVDDAFTYQKWIDNLKAGRAFVSNGPMLDLEVDEQLPGSEVRLPAPGEVHFVGRVRGRSPIARVEALYNGEVVATLPLKKPQRDCLLDTRLEIPRSGWIALRAVGPPDRQQPSGEVFAHTSAVYVEVAGKPIDARRDAEYFVGWIDRLRTDIRRRNRIPSRHQEHVEGQISAARAVFNGLLKVAD